MDDLQVYETLDTLAETMDHSIMHPDGELAELLMALTGTEIAERGTMAGLPTHNPDRSAAARKTVLRWLRDHGYVARPTSGVVDQYRELRDNG